MADTDAYKTEQVIGINSFNEPLELSGPNAWATMVANLIFMRKGTIPTDPNMGCEIQKYEFSFIDDVRTEIEQTIREQVSTYLSDIPLSSVTVSTDKSTGKSVLLIILSFDWNDNNETVVVATEKGSTDSVLNFAIV